MYELYHCSTKARKSAKTIGYGWTIIMTDYSQKDVSNLVNDGHQVFSSLGAFECSGIPRKALVVFLVR